MPANHVCLLHMSVRQTLDDRKHKRKDCGRLNRQKISLDHKILLFMDNACCHPEHLCGKCPNIKVCFLPANTTFTPSAAFRSGYYQKLLAALPFCYSDLCFRSYL